MRYKFIDLPDEENDNYRKAKENIKAYINDMEKMGYCLDVVEKKLQSLVCVLCYEKHVFTDDM